MNKKVLILVIVMLLISSITVLAEDPYSLNEAIKGNSNVLGKLGGSKDTLVGMSKSFFDITRYVVMSIILIRMFMLYMDFANAGDNPQLVASIKSKALWYVLALLFVLNFWSIYIFVTDIMAKLNIL